MKKPGICINKCLQFFIGSFKSYLKLCDSVNKPFTFLIMMRESNMHYIVNSLHIRITNITVYRDI